MGKFNKTKQSVADATQSLRELNEVLNGFSLRFDEVLDKRWRGARCKEDASMDRRVFRVDGAMSILWDALEVARVEASRVLEDEYETEED